MTDRGKQKPPPSPPERRRGRVSDAPRSPQREGPLKGPLEESGKPPLDGPPIPRKK